MQTHRYVAIDEEGYFVFDGRRVDDASLGGTLIQNLKMDDDFRLSTSMDGQMAWVEAFDSPLVVRHLRLADGSALEADLPYGQKARISLESLSVDEWDRFHGTNEIGVPLVFSRQAQMEFFEFLDEFDDDSITVKGQRFQMPAWLQSAKDVEDERFWSEKYREGQPRWELGQPSPVLPAVLPQLKLAKSRVLVLGCGSGHDAAYFAKQGHLVTAVDFSPEALARAQKNYGDLDNLKLHQGDALRLPENWAGQFDLVFEHTCYCAIDPSERNRLVGVWQRLLQPQGHLLGCFFVMEKRQGPPFGGSEWELRERLKGKFDFLYWTRWHQPAAEWRTNTELVVYARKRS